MIDIAIIDDESKMRSLLRSLLVQEFDWVNFIGEANSVKSGIELIESQRPQIILLDVEMGDGTGFDLVSKLRHGKPQVIFVTAFNRYAVKALRARAVDFVDKPINPDELFDAMLNAKEIVESEYQPSFEALFKALKSNMNGMIAVPTRQGMIHLEAANISCIKAEGAYSEIHFTNGKKTMMISRMLKDILPALEKLGFTRPHRSYLVNTAKIQEIIRTDGGSILLTDGQSIPFSKQHKEIALIQIREMTTFL